MKQVRLIATDLDGTLVGRASEFALYGVLREKINDLRSRNNAHWVICTGRSLRGFAAFFKPLLTMGNVPDFVITRHAFIQSRGAYGYAPHILWNVEVLYHMWRHNRATERALDHWHDEISSRIIGVRLLARRPSRLTLQFQTEADAQQAEEILQPKVCRFRHFTMYRNKKALDLAAVPFAKGLSLAELERHLGINPENVLAIGNGLNDITMFDESVAEFTGCPSNSEFAVMNTVRDRGGHVASKRTLAGVLEIIAAYEQCEIRSELPAEMADYAPLISAKRDRDRLERARRRRRTIWLSAALVYVILLVFASFEMIPGVSHIIMLPVTLLAWLLHGIASLLGSSR